MSRRVQLVKLALVSGAGTMSMLLALALSSVAQATTFPYTFLNVGGTKTIIRSYPTRIAIYGGPGIVLGALASFGVKPIVEQDDTYPDVGPGQSATGIPYADYNGGELTGVHSIIGGTTGPNYEAIATYHPDLIITTHSQYASQFDAIAPTISVNTGVTNGTYQFVKGFYAQQVWTELAPVFDKTARVDEVLYRLHDRTAALSGFAKGISVNIPEFAPGQDFYLVISDQSLGGIFDSTGAKILSIPHWCVLTAGMSFALVSYELLPIATVGTIGHPTAAVVENANGVKLFALGHGYHATPTSVYGAFAPRPSERSDTGCVNVSNSAGKKLLSSAPYDVAIKKSATVLLKGTIAIQDPAFFGNGKDKQYNAPGSTTT